MTGTPPEDVAALRAERDALERRALEAERIAEDLADALAEAQHQLAERPDGPAYDPSHLSLMDGASPVEPGHGQIAPDGSDRAVLPLALAATAVVAFLVAVVTVVAGRFGFTTVLALAAAGALGWAASRTRVHRVGVEVVDGVVRVEEGGTTRTFDLRNPGVKLDVQGRPGNTSWRVRFYRRGLEPVDVDAAAVDPEEFMAQLREHRPGL